MNKIYDQKIPAKIRKALVISAVVVSVIAVLVVAFQLIGSLKAENSSIIVYRKGSETVVRIDDTEKYISDLTAGSFKCDKENARVFYTVESSYSNGLFDLYFIEKNRSEISKPKIIDIGIHQDYDVVDGKVYYLKKNVSAGAFEGNVCDIESNKIKAFSGNTENLYPLDGETVYYTKMHGNTRVLYRYNSVESEEICRELANIVSFNDVEKPHIIFEKKSAVNTGMTELFVAHSGSEPVMICDNTYHVMYDDYAPEGNLYYFSSSSESVSWSYVIADQYAETDPEIVKPKRDNFFAILGISVEYNEAFKKYQEKLIRDEIRTALNESVENGEFTVPVFNAFAYTENGSIMIAENVDPKNVYAVSLFGSPKIIYEDTEVLPSDTDMNTLVEIAQRSEMREVINYAKTIVEESVESQGMAYAAHSDNGIVTRLLEGYDKSKTLFSFSRNGDRIFAFVRETQGERLNLYTNSLGSGQIPSEEIIVDTGLSSYGFTGDSVVYLKSDRNKISGDVYYYDGTESKKLSNSASAFMVKDNKDIVVLKNHNPSSSKQTADYYFYNDGEEKLIGNGAVVESFNCCGSKKAAYISQDNKLYIFGGNKSSSVDENVSEILLFA